MSHERKTVGHWARTKIQAIEAFTEHAKQSDIGTPATYLTDLEWQEAFIKWIEAPPQDNSNDDRRLV